MHVVRNWRGLKGVLPIVRLIHPLFWKKKSLFVYLSRVALG